MTLEKIKDIEMIIDACIEAHDHAVKTKNHKMAAQAIEVINYELDKLDKNEIVLKTEKIVHFN